MVPIRCTIIIYSKHQNCSFFYFKLFWGSQAWETFLNGNFISPSWGLILLMTDTVEPHASGPSAIRTNLFW